MLAAFEPGPPPAQVDLDDPLPQPHLIDARGQRLGQDADPPPAGVPEGRVVAQSTVLDAQGAPFAIVVSNPNPSAGVTVTLENVAGVTQNVSVGPGAGQTVFHLHWHVLGGNSLPGFH